MISSSRESLANPYDSLEETAKTIIGKSGQIVIDRNLGYLTAKGTPKQVARVQRWVKTLQSSLMTSISIDMQIYALQITHQSAMPFPAGTTLPPDKGSIKQIKDSSFAVELSKFGKVTPIHDWHMVTNNGHAENFQHVSNIFYIRSCRTNDKNSIASLNLGVVKSGFTGLVVPRLFGNKILLQISLLFQNLQKLDEINFNNCKMQLPVTYMTTMDNQISLQDNQTLVIQSYIDNAPSLNPARSFLANLKLLGNNNKLQKKKTLIYVLVKAHKLKDLTAKMSDN